ncbi:MAG: hypothetical protein ACLP52_00790 [Streptosporangiaceae bacterium]
MRRRGGAQVTAGQRAQTCVDICGQLIRGQACCLVQVGQHPCGLGRGQVRGVLAPPRRRFQPCAECLHPPGCLFTAHLGGAAGQVHLVKKQAGQSAGMAGH